MTPARDYVLIRRIRDEKIGRFYVPGNVDTKPRIGIVEAVGPGRWAKDGRSRLPMDVQVGDRVKFDAGARGFVVALQGNPLEERLLLPQDGIEAILPAEAEVSAVASPWPRYVADGVQG